MTSLQQQSRHEDQPMLKDFVIPRRKRSVTFGDELLSDGTPTSNHNDYSGTPPSSGDDSHDYFGQSKKKKRRNRSHCRRSHHSSVINKYQHHHDDIIEIRSTENAVLISGINGLQQQYKKHIGDIRAEVEKSFRTKSNMIVLHCHVFSTIETDSTGKHYHAMVEFSTKQMAQRATMEPHTINGYSVTIQPWKVWYDTVDDRLLSSSLTIARTGCAISVGDLSVQTTSQDVVHFFSHLLKRNPSIVVQCGILQSYTYQYSSKEAYVEFDDPSIVDWILHLDTLQETPKHTSLGYNIQIRPWKLNRPVRPFLSKRNHDQYRRDPYIYGDEAGDTAVTFPSSDDQYCGDSYSRDDEAYRTADDHTDRNEANVAATTSPSTEDNYRSDSCNHHDEAGGIDDDLNDSSYSSGTEEGELKEGAGNGCINNPIPDFTTSDDVASFESEPSLNEHNPSEIDHTEGKAEEAPCEDAIPKPSEELVEVNITKKDDSSQVIDEAIEVDKNKKDDEAFTGMDRNKIDETMIERDTGDISSANVTNGEILQPQIRAMQVQIDAMRSQYGQLELSFFNHRSIMADDHRRLAQKLHDETTQRMEAEKRLHGLEAKLNSI